MVSGNDDCSRIKLLTQLSKFSQVTGDDVDNGGGLNINNNARNALLRQRAPAPRGFNPVNVNFNELPSELRHRSRFI